MTNDIGPSSSFFDSAYRGTAPWDVGRAQPALTDMFEDFTPSDPVLDVGCGTGDLSLFLAGCGLSVIGIDLAEGAVIAARSKASRAEALVRNRVEFRVGDALHVAMVRGHLRTVVDSGFFHLFGPDDRQEFAEQLAAKLPIGGRYYLLGFAFEPPMPNAPREVRADELRTLFGPERGWRILALRPAEFLTVHGNVPAVVACFERS